MTPIESPILHVRTAMKAWGKSVGFQEKPDYIYQYRDRTFLSWSPQKIATGLARQAATFGVLADAGDEYSSGLVWLDFERRGLAWRISRGSFRIALDQVILRSAPTPAGIRNNARLSVHDAIVIYDTVYGKVPTASADIEIRTTTKQRVWQSNIAREEAAANYLAALPLGEYRPHLLFAEYNLHATPSMQMRRGEFYRLAESMLGQRIPLHGGYPYFRKTR